MKSAGILLAIAAALLLSSCGLFTPHYAYRYRVTVEVETPQGIRSGSSVWEVKQWEESSFLHRGLVSLERGEAVAVDLPGGTLFALLRGQDMNVDYAAGVVDGHLSQHPMPGLVMTRDWAEDVRRIKKAMPSFDLDPDEYPLLVRFRDSNDPTSVEKVEPNQLPAALGKGVHLRRISVALTSDRPGQRVEEQLPWLRTHRGALDKSICEDLLHLPLSCRLTDSDLRTGM